MLALYMHSLFNPHSNPLRYIQSTLLIRGFRIHGFNQLWIRNIGKIFRKFQKAKLKFAAMLAATVDPQTTQVEQHRSTYMLRCLAAWQVSTSNPCSRVSYIHIAFTLY